jgi:hypothetical protein
VAIAATTTTAKRTANALFQRDRRLVDVDVVDLTCAPCLGGPAAIPSTTG